MDNFTPGHSHLFLCFDLGLSETEVGLESSLPHGHSLSYKAAFWSSFTPGHSQLFKSDSFDLPESEGWYGKLALTRPVSFIYGSILGLVTHNCLNPAALTYLNQKAGMENSLLLGQSLSFKAAFWISFTTGHSHLFKSIFFHMPESESLVWKTPSQSAILFNLSSIKFEESSLESI